MRKTLALLTSLTCIATAAEPGNVEIVMSTAKGDIAIELDLVNAPISAGNFLTLVDGGHLDGATFYRTVSPDNDNGSPPISVIQGGLQDAAETFETIEHETTELTGLKHVDGAVSMARADVGTASTEFFICIGDQPALDYGATRNEDGQGFAVFGRVVAGMDVARDIHETPADAAVDFDYFKGQIYEEPIVIERVQRTP